MGGWKWCDLIAVDPIDQPHADVDARLDAFTTHASNPNSFAELRRAFENDPAIQPPAGVTND
jgi:hypothetical protein